MEYIRRQLSQNKSNRKLLSSVILAKVNNLNLTNIYIYSAPTVQVYGVLVLKEVMV